MYSIPAKPNDENNKLSDGRVILELDANNQIANTRNGDGETTLELDANNQIANTRNDDKETTLELDANNQIANTRNGNGETTLELETKNQINNAGCEIITRTSKTTCARDPDIISSNSKVAFGYYRQPRSKKRRISKNLCRHYNIPDHLIYVDESVDI